MLTVLRRFLDKRRAPTPFQAKPLSAGPETQPPAPFPIEYYIDRFWCDQYGMYFQGWAHAHDEPVRRLRIAIGDDITEVTEFSDRPDLLDFYPDKPAVVRSGFGVFALGRPGEPVTFTIVTDRGEATISIRLPRFDLPAAPKDKDRPFWQFVNTVNRERLTVLEIGSRIVGDESQNCRELFPDAARFIGTDIHPSPTVDQVADVHNLSADIGEEAVDAIFSRSVLEHLPYPWLAAREINRTLKTGGLLFHGAPQSWPLHEMPNDFWRFSDEGLKILFGPEMGFEVLRVEMLEPVALHPQQRQGALAKMPLNPGFGNAIIMSRKVRHLPRDAVTWPTDPAQAHARSKEYPQGK